MPAKESVWYTKVADLIVRQSVNIKQAALMEGIELDGEELQRIYKSRSFQRVLWQCRFDYYNEIASSPARGKAAILGLMTLAVQNLAAEGEWKEVLEGALKLAKVEGWTTGDQNVNVFANLTSKDIEEARKRLEGLVKPAPTTEGTSELLSN